MTRPISFLIDPPEDGKRNMEVDSEALQRAEASLEPITIIRFYQWSTATVSLGKHQSPEKACDTEFCKLNDIPIVHRPTGGRAVLHDNELTYSVVSNDPCLFPVNDLMGTYRVISNGLREGFTKYGINVIASSGTRENENAGKHLMQSPCFSSPTRHELMFEGRKLAGSAQRRLKHSFLQHGSIPIRVDYRFMAHALATEPELLRAQMISIEEVSGEDIELGELIKALRAGFEEILAREIPTPHHSDLRPA